MKHIREGKASLYVSKDAFYNPKMSELRDISVMFLNAVSTKNRKVLDSTAATGVRAIRYSLEAGANDVTLLDINKKAAGVAKKNLKLNHLNFKVINKSIQQFANSQRERFGIIDHDPFGSPAPNIFDLMKLCWDGTILMITATDTAVLCGAHAGACIKTYGAKPLHNELCKEVGLRILLSYISKTAAQFNFGTVPLLSISDMHYMRVFVRVDFGAAKAIESVKASGLGTFCRNCYVFGFSRGVAPQISGVCTNCKSVVEAFGPLWLGQLYDKKILKKMLRSPIIEPEKRKIKLMYDELDVPLFYSVPRLTKHLGVTSISHYKVMEKLAKSGATVTGTQFDQTGFKTDATSSEVLKVVRSLS